MQMTTYTIEKTNGRYRLKHYDGPYKSGLEKIPADGQSWLDEAGLLHTLIRLRVPDAQRATALEDLHSQQIVNVTFDAKTNEPLPL
jgi:hypothetical protein